MTDQGPQSPDKSFARPWEPEESDEETVGEVEESADVAALSALSDSHEEETESELAEAETDEPESPGSPKEDADVPITESEDTSTDVSEEGAGPDPEDGGDVFAVADEVALHARPELEEYDWDAMTSGSPSLDQFTSDEYTAAATMEHQGLAEEINRAEGEEWAQQAVAAALPGVESGLVGFEDVGGVRTESEESLEAVEQAASSDLTMRIASALVIFGLFLGSLVLGGWWFTVFVMLVMVVAVGEFYSTLRAHDYKPLALFGLAGVVLMGLGAHSVGPIGISGWAAALTLATALFFATTPRSRPLENASVTVLGMAWVGMLTFVIPIAAGPSPVAHILFLLLLIAFNDIGSYFVGRAFGRKKLAPNISPGKTVEGFIGGLIVVTIAAAVMVTFPVWEMVGLSKGLVAAGVIGLLVPLGDLSESMVKRSLGVKDMGSVLPGHGGMLDRIDGFLFALPAIYLLFRAFGLL